MSSRLVRVLRGALLVALFFIVFGTHLAVVGRFGSDLPHWDQWDGEGAQALLPYLQHRLTLADLISPNNEHRIACTRLLSLGLLALNGQWDARLECVVNAAMFSVLAVLFFRFGRDLLGRGRRAVWFAAVAALTAPPIAWQNVLGALHSAEYFLFAFSLAALALLLTARPWSASWWTGLGCAYAALFTMASGLLAAATVVAVLAVSGRPRDVWRRHGATLVACLPVIVLGWMLRVTVAQNAVLEAHSIADFAVTFWRNLEWPGEGFGLLALVVWLPWALLAWRLWRRPDSAPPRWRVIVAVGGWVLLQFAAIAYGRGAGGAAPASRYLDTMAIGLLVNVLALLVLPFPAASASGWLRWSRRAIAAGWFVIVGIGVVRHLSVVLAVELPPVAAQLRREEIDTRAYLATDDTRYLNGPIPYPSKATLIERLSHPRIRAVMPSSVRPPIDLTGTAGPPGSFVRGGTPRALPPPPGWRTWGSFAGPGAANEGEWRSESFFQPLSGYWRFEVAGNLGQPGLSLEITAHTTGAPLAVVAPRRSPGDTWRTVIVPAPSTSAEVVARDTSATGWLAFTAPVEVGPLSYWAWRLARAGGSIALAAGGAALLLLAAVTLAPVAGSADRPRSD